MEGLLTIVRRLRARRVVEVGHGRNLRYLKGLLKAGIDAWGVEIDVQHVRRALEEEVPSVNVDAVEKSRWVRRVLRPDLVYAVRPPVELAVGLIERYPTVALRMREEERHELPEPSIQIGDWDLHTVLDLHTFEEDRTVKPQISG
ncbi:UPF0146 family protein [Methanopyrus kandleri]|uniref:Uncharacterized protein conserved in archaea n=1 Tax=Methanopyrus kandleri (strain AV19 / DSM 6324 / JCM 9639 / NBRC 100938) TaxID=190192 RepID=Q8TW32_METKA|nr:UPF0146 family protein [Methanopyrus kandleri]AAM02418.1 Uncharacterized protein conserved in archaea [Methanopyrus kandleri AV19]